MNLSQHLRRRRLSHGLSQADLALILQMNRQTYTKYENGDALPSIHVLCQLADFYRISLDELVGHVSLSEEWTKTEKLLLSLGKHLPKEKKELLFQMLKQFLGETLLSQTVIKH